MSLKVLLEKREYKKVRQMNEEAVLCTHGTKFDVDQYLKDIFTWLVLRLNYSYDLLL